MVGILCAVDKQGWRFPNIENHNVHVAVIIDVAKSSAASTGQLNLRQPRGRGDVFERAITQVPEQLRRLAISWTAGDRIHLRIDVPIGDEEIQPPIVVEIDKTGSPFHVEIAWLCRFRSPSEIDEALRAKIAIKVVGLLGEIGDIDTQAPTVIIVAEVHTHGT